MDVPLLLALGAIIAAAAIGLACWLGVRRTEKAADRMTKAWRI